MIFVKEDTAVTIMVGPFLDATDGVTEEAGLSPVSEISKNGGAFATGPTGTHSAEGWYTLALTAAHTNTAGVLIVKAHDSANHLPVWHEVMVMPTNVWDSMFGTDKLQVDVSEWLGTAAATPTVAGVPEVDMTHISGTSPAADKLETACDNYSATRGLTGTALPAAAADGAGGVPISDAGGLDLDAMNTNINDIETGTAGAATAAALATVDTVVDAIKLETDKLTLGDAGSGVTGSIIEEVENNAASIAALNDVAKTEIVSAGPITTLAGAVVNVDLVDVTTTNTDVRGTDSAALASACTEARLSELDAATGGKMANQVDGIQTDLSNGTDGLGALKSLIDTVDTVADAIKAETALIVADTGTDGVVVASLKNNAITAAATAADFVDLLWDETEALPGQEAPAATQKLRTMLAYLYKAWRNKVLQSATEYKLYADNGTTLDQKATLSDDDTDFTKGEVGTGA